MKERMTIAAEMPNRRTRVAKNVYKYNELELGAADGGDPVEEAPEVDCEAEVGGKKGSVFEDKVGDVIGEAEADEVMDVEDIVGVGSRPATITTEIERLNASRCKGTWGMPEWVYYIDLFRMAWELK
jgi:hypothetical protein